MAAFYPENIKTFNAKDPGDPIQSAHINDLQNEVVAIETQLGTNAGTWQDYTPTWTATITNPTLPGTLTGRYVQVGKMVTVQIYLLCGESTTYGSGNYAFSLPVAASAGASYAWGIARFRIPGKNYSFLVIVSPSDTAISGFVEITNGTNVNAITPTVPATWQNGASLGLQITYEAA